MNTKPLISALDGVLRPCGFFRHKHTWNRKSPPFVDSIDFQKSDFTNSITINCGVLHTDAYRICWNEDVGAVVYVPNCAIQVRIGRLMDGLDHWWECKDCVLPVDEIAGNVQAFVLPFLDTLHSETAMENYLVQKQAGKKGGYHPPIILLATLQSWRGDKESAVKTLTPLVKQTLSVSWKQATKEVAERLGLTLDE